MMCEGHKRISLRCVQISPQRSLALSGSGRRAYYWQAAEGTSISIHAHDTADRNTPRSRIPYDSLLRLSTTFDKIKICIMRMKSSS
jgi:hypothetical protein